jgi:hypothetical protein
MRSVYFDRWCSAAVGRIRFVPDRWEVYEELYAHMEDQYEELTAGGLSEKEAEKEVTAAMGDPYETARQLERIHRPFWGYALRAARWCLLIAAVLALLTVPRYIKGLEINDARYGEGLFRETWDDGIGEFRLVWYVEPTVRGRCDGYTFTVTRAAQRSYVGWENHTYDGDFLVIEVKVFNPRPWAEPCAAIKAFTAVDSLGNVYFENDSWIADSSAPYLSGTWGRTGLLTWTWEITLNGSRSQEAEWIELRYRKSGRNLCLTIDLRDKREAGA